MSDCQPPRSLQIINKDIYACLYSLLSPTVVRHFFWGYASAEASPYFKYLHDVHYILWLCAGNKPAQVQLPQRQQKRVEASGNLQQCVALAGREIGRR